MNEITLSPIGYVRNGITELVDENWGNVVSEIIIKDKALLKGLNGIEEFSHAIIIFYMHRSTFDIKKDVSRKPGGREDMPELGIFSQRAKHRPNPIGITTVEIIKIENDNLVVKGLDAVDWTPILDIKPYFPVFDQANNAKTPAWVDEFMKNYF